MKRPSCHNWAIFVLIAFLVTNLILAIKVAFDFATGLMLILCCAGLIGSFVFSRSNRTYVIAAFTLALIVLRGLYYGVVLPAQQLLTHNPASQQGWLPIGLQAFFALLLCVLFYAYTFGVASRQFYGYAEPSIPIA